MIPREAIIQSNLIEGIDVGDGHPLLDNHLLAARCVDLAAAVGEILHPRVLHSILFNGLSLPLGHVPGQYRMCEVRVGEYAPPLADQVANRMEAWWGFIDEDLSWDNHAHFEAIHPFVDGNGRVGRLVYWNQQLILGEDLEIISAAKRYTYYDRLEEWRKINFNAE